MNDDYKICDCQWNEWISQYLMKSVSKVFFMVKKVLLRDRKFTLRNLIKKE